MIECQNCKYFEDCTKVGHKCTSDCIAYTINSKGEEKMAKQQTFDEAWAELKEKYSEVIAEAEKIKGEMEKEEKKEKVKPDFLKLCMEGSEDMTETVHKVVANMEYKFETDAIIALLQKLLQAVRNYYLGYRTFKGVQGIQVEGALECIIAAMEAELKKNEEVNKEN